MLFHSWFDGLLAYLSSFLPILQLLYRLAQYICLNQVAFIFIEIQRKMLTFESRVSIEFELLILSSKI